MSEENSTAKIQVCKACGKPLRKNYGKIYCSHKCRGFDRELNIKKICKQCGAEFHSDDASAMFCSVACRAEASKVIRPNCRFCGKMLHTKGGKIYCNNICRSADRTIIKLCIGCGKEFSVSLSAVDKYNYCTKQCKADSLKRNRAKVCIQCGSEFISKSLTAKYCSYRCSADSRKIVIPSVCKHCKKDFNAVKNGNRQITVYCSRDCHMADRKQARIAKLPGGIERIYCERCGKPLRKWNQTNLRFCSKACHRPLVMITCPTCKKEFQSHRPDTRFCSFACYRKSNIENLLERDVRLSLELLGIQYKQEWKAGRYSVDFYLPDLGVALEVDGDYWHQNKDRDKRKNLYLNGIGLIVCRLKESDLRSAPILADYVANRIAKTRGVKMNSPQKRLF